jgi:hypothetical protein
MPVIQKIPFTSKGESSKPLKRCIRHAAQENGVSEFVVARVMADFLTQLAEEVSTGNVVSIPGFGKFGAIPVEPKRPRPNGQPFVVPRLYPARAFRNECDATCSVPRARKNVDALRGYARHQHPTSRPERAHSRVFTAMKSFKERLTAQERALL